MNTQQDKYTEMQAKLKKGLEKLEQISIDDSDGMGAALIKLHGAMEDFVRLEVARKAPELGEALEDHNKTSWRDLLDYGQTYLGFTDNDRNIVSEANYQRNAYAHGGNYRYTYSDLKNYAQFVQRWINRASVPAAGDWGRKPIVEQPRPVQTAYPTAARPVSQPRPQPAGTYVYENPAQRPWYRSTLFLFVIFFLFPPLWALLIVTDRNQGCLAKLIAYSVFLMIFLCVIGVLPYSETVLDAFQVMLEQPIAGPGPGSTPSNGETPVSETASAVPGGSVPGSGNNATCTIVWVEHTADDLGGKSRAMVWEEKVMKQVSGSGMTAREFYDSVVEHNPELKTDGYEFKKGKTYLLPECQ